MRTRIVLCYLIGCLLGLVDARASEAPVIRSTYPNGLVLLSQESHAAPVVSVWVYYKVGSRDEVIGIRGISHQVEHMMFKGTDRLGPGDIDKLFSERGGVNNAMTTQDYTAYNESLPSSALMVALKVEADRMEHASMLASELAHEKSVVLSELEGDENSPLYKLDSAVTEAAFCSHPYHTPIGGFLADVHGFDRAQVEHYYATHYGPNNAILVVVGDFNTPALKKVVGQLFSGDKWRPVAEHPIPPESPQNGERRVNVSGVGDTSYVEIAYHVPATGRHDHYVMDVISTVLGSGRSSRLYRSLVQKGLATEVQAGDPDMKDPFLMQITATVATGHTSKEVEDAIELEIERLKTDPVTDRELQKTVNQVKASFVYRDDSVTDQASELGMYASLGDYRYMDTYLPHILAVSPADIPAAAQKYFTVENRTVGWYIPRPPRPGEALPTGGRAGAMHYKQLPSLAAWNHPHLNAGLWSEHGKVGPTNRRAPTDLPASLERLIGRRRPKPKANAKSEADMNDDANSLLIPSSTRNRVTPVRQALSNGLVVIVYPNHSNPDVSISGGIRAGAFSDPPGKEGTASLTAAMLEHGTTGRSEEEIAATLDYVAASVDVTAGGSGTFFTGHTLVENLPLTLHVLAEELQRPTFPPAVFARVKNEVLTEIQAANDDPTTVASHNLFAALYPEDYPLHWPVTGTVDTVSRVTREDLQQYHDRYYRPDLSEIVIVGDVDPQSAIKEVARSFEDWNVSGPPPDTTPPAIGGDAPATRIVKTMPDKSEAVVAMGFRGISRNNPDYYAAYLMNLILGNGDFNSRLMKDIRDRNGLVYYVASSWEAGLAPGPWVLEMEANPSDVDRAVAAAVSDLQAMQAGGATPDEIHLFKGWVKGNRALQLETDAGIADTLMQDEYFGLGLDFLWKYPALVGAVTPHQIADAARRYLHPDAAVISIAGPYPPPPSISVPGKP